MYVAIHVSGTVTSVDRVQIASRPVRVDSTNFFAVWKSFEESVSVL